MTGGARSTVSGSTTASDTGGVGTAGSTAAGSSGALAARCKLGDEPGVGVGKEAALVDMLEERVKGEPPNNTLPLLPVQAGAFFTTGTCSTSTGVIDAIGAPVNAVNPIVESAADLQAQSAHSLMMQVPPCTWSTEHNQAIGSDTMPGRTRGSHRPS